MDRLCAFDFICEAFLWRAMQKCYFVFKKNRKKLNVKRMLENQIESVEEI